MLCDRLLAIVKSHSTVPGAVAVFAAVWVLMLAVDNGETGAQWVDAIGSVGAILAAAWIASSDRRAARFRDDQRAQVVCIAIERLVNAALLDMDLLNQAMAQYPEVVTSSSPEFIRDRVARVELRLQELKGVDLMQLPTPEVVGAVIGIVTVFEGSLFKAKVSRDTRLELDERATRPLFYELKAGAEHHAVLRASAKG